MLYRSWFICPIIFWYVRFCMTVSQYSSTRSMLMLYLQRMEYSTNLISTWHILYTWCWSRGVEIRDVSLLPTYLWCEMTFSKAYLMDFYNVTGYNVTLVLATAIPQNDVFNTSYSTCVSAFLCRCYTSEAFMVLMLWVGSYKPFFSIYGIL